MHWLGLGLGGSVGVRLRRTREVEHFVRRLLHISRRDPEQELPGAELPDGERRAAVRREAARRMVAERR